MFAPNGLARAALRFRPSAFVGTFIALAMAAMVVSACGILLETGVRASVPPTRYAHAPVVAAADQRAPYGHGDNADSDERPDHDGEQGHVDGEPDEEQGLHAPAVVTASETRITP